ncbi:MAG: hypothetical protein H6940_03145 [Burkholderiales bacterium]|nr:hypothetical protein [Burkholderiales bacterium]
MSRLPWLTWILPNWLRETLLQHSSPVDKQRIVQVWQSLFSQLTSEAQHGALQLDFSTPSKRQFSCVLTSSG